ncbi:Lrp/AsnC family transcriptional regulator [Brevibacillus sp. H7]|uniref:Lrp/AsnC family transcriptional regulator n=1 Tax=Brevibacillus sp. H7 TaxID=3349138 RepID=UPI0037FC768D
MDGLDQKIMELLKQNSRMTSSEISRQIHLSVPAVAERIRKLEEGGVIQSFTVKLNREKSGILLVAFILIQLDKPEHITGFKEMVLQEKRVLECHHIAGGYDYLLKVAVANTGELEHLISHTLKNGAGVAKTNTMIALSTVKEEM